jgi:metal-sulfur cluster biosynthetic enzyme
MVTSAAPLPAAGRETQARAEDVRAALESVNDPHVPASLRRMGMLAGVKTEPDGRVQVRVRVPCTACPGTAMIRDGITAAVAAVPGVTAVEVTEDWADPWHRDLVEDETRQLMQRNGIQI